MGDAADVMLSESDQDKKLCKERHTQAHSREKTAVGGVLQWQQSPLPPVIMGYLIVFFLYCSAFFKYSAMSARGFYNQEGSSMDLAVEAGNRSQN